MASNEVSSNSLQELATLLSYLYDHYIQKYSSNNLNGLVAFLGDMGLLGNRITVLEIENICRTIYSSRESSHSSTNSRQLMTYEEFYLWLREIACCLYYEQLLCPKKSLHKLLVEKIIPFGSNWGVFVFSDRLTNTVSSAILEGIFYFHDFFRYWYIDLTMKSHPSTSLVHQWEDIIKTDATLTGEYLLTHLEDIAIIPQKISRRDVLAFVQSLISASSEIRSERHHNLNFSDFLFIFGFISSSISLHHDGRSMTMYHSGLHLVVQTVSELLLALGLKRWSHQQGNQRAEISERRTSIQKIINEPSSGFFSLQTLLILCRNGNIFQSLQELVNLLDVSRKIRRSKNQMQRGDVPLLIPYSQLSEVLSTICQKLCPPKAHRGKNSRLSSHSLIYNTDTPEKYLSTLVGGSEISLNSLLIACTRPELFYASSILSISLLEPLYSDKSLWALENSQPLIRILESLEDRSNAELSYLKKYSNLSNQKHHHNLARLFHLLHDCSIIPHLADERKIKATFRYILGLPRDFRFNFESPILITEIQMIELLFGIAAIIFCNEGGSLILTSKPNRAGEVDWLTPSGSNEIPSESIFIKDDVDRFLCLIQLCDPVCRNQPLLSRLEIKRVDQVVPHQAENDNSSQPSNSTSIQPSTIEFSPHFGYLFTQFLTRANMFYFETVQGIPAFKRFEMTFIQKSLLALLLFYPVNDFAFSPWDLADLITHFSNARDDNNYLNDSDSNFSNVQLDLRHILLRYQISGVNFERYIEHVLDKTKLSNAAFLSTLNDQPYQFDQNSDSCLMSLFFPLIRNLFDETNRELLKEGNFLFIWEYLRCLRGNSRNDFTGKRVNVSGYVLKPNPFMEQFRSPFPTRYLFQTKSNEFGISWKAASQWGLINNIHSSICLKWYRAILLITGNTGLHYSGFIFFVICCYVEMKLSELAIKWGSITEVIVTDAVKEFYQHVTTHIQQFQQIAPQSLFPIILDMNVNPSIHRDDLEDILHATLSLPFSDHTTKLMPSRPDTSLWDAPRWLEYCKRVGITELVSSFPSLWHSYRVCLRETLQTKDLENWDESVIPPIAVRLDSSTVLRCLDHMNHKSITLSQIVCSYHVPFIASHIDDSLTPSELLHIPDNHGMLLEDLFRFGGNRVLSAIEYSSPWLQEVYYQLAESALVISSDHVEQAPKEPLLTTVCRFISSTKLFTLGNISVLVKQCFGFRTRFFCHVEPTFAADNSFSTTFISQEHDVSLSFAEFEELILRCAYQVWEKAGLMATHEKEWYGKGLFESVSHFFPHDSDKLVSKYCQDCRSSLDSSRSNQVVTRALQSSNRVIQGGRTWGVDYLSPFLEVFRQFELPISTVKEKHELVAQYVGESLKSKPTASSTVSIKNQPTEVDLRPHLAHQLERMKSAKASLLDQERIYAEENLKNVVVRSEELVASILAKRDEYDFLASITHPPSPPPIVKEQTRMQLSPASQRYASCYSKDRLHKRQERMAQLADMKKQREQTPSPQEQIQTRTPARGRKKHQPHPRNAASPPTSMKRLVDNSLFVGIQEALWPVFATYCSCGDSTDPGKLSGPNLFTLLSKLNILTNHTTLSDIGILLHQISAHSLSISPFISTTPSDIHTQQVSSPLLSFEEFIIFLCAFSELRSDGVVHLPSFLSSNTNNPGDSFDHDHWLYLWNNYFLKSKSFTALFHDCILPVVNQSFLLASPDDARERDVYSLLFSLDALFSIETIEKEMLRVYSMTNMPTLSLQSKADFDLMMSHILEIFKSIKLVPQVITEKDVKKLYEDIIPSSPFGKVEKSPHPHHAQNSSSLQFPRWEWVSCVVAFKAVMYSLEKSHSDQNITSLVTEVLSAMVDAMNSSLAQVRHRELKSRL